MTYASDGEPPFAQKTRMPRKTLTDDQIALRREAEKRKKERKSQRDADARRTAEEKAEHHRSRTAEAQASSVLTLLHNGVLVGGLAGVEQNSEPFIWEVDSDGGPLVIDGYEDLDEAVFEFLIWEDDAVLAREGDVRIEPTNDEWARRLEDYRSRFDEWHKARYGG